MTTTPRARSVSELRERDWPYRLNQQEGHEPQSEEQLSVLRCSFRITPETSHSVPAPYNQNVQFHQATANPDSVPWTGYYAIYNGAKLAVSNAYGVWFEITPHQGGYRAIWKARDALQLYHWPCEGIDMAFIKQSGEPIITTHVYGTHQTSEHPSCERRDLPPTRPTDPFSSQIEKAQWGRGGKKPRGDGDDPYTLDDLSDNEDWYKGGQLEGNPPTKFNGNWSKTVEFLGQFKCFMRINKAATIAKDPYKKSAYFLSLLEGPNVEGWLACQDEWLDKVDEDPTILPWRMNEWDVLESKFKKSLTDYAEQERANEELQQLKMQSSDIDGYIVRFSQLAHRGGHNIDKPFVMQLFAQGLPKSLMESCFDLHNPKTFEEWALSAQRNHKVWLKKQAARGSFNATQRDNQALFWKDNSIGDEGTKEEDRNKGKPMAAEAKANGMEAIQDSLDLLIQMPWIQVLLCKKSTLRKRNSIIGRKDDALNAQKLDILHDSVLTENPVPRL